MDWFAASLLAKGGAPIRRVAWTDKWLVFHEGLWWFTVGSTSTIVKTTEFGENELRARDWTDQAFNADPCASLPAFNQVAPVYGSWTDDPIFLPPPIPGYPTDE